MAAIDPFSSKAVTSQRDNAAALPKIAFSIPVAAHLVDSSRSAMYREIVSGRLRVTKIGRRSVILRTDLEAWLRNLRSNESATGQRLARPCSDLAAAAAPTSANLPESIPPTPGAESEQQSPFKSEPVSRRRLVGLKGAGTALVTR